MYLLAKELAKKTQKAYHFENGAEKVEYVGQSYWDTTRDGLLSGEILYLALKSMEAACVTGLAQCTMSYEFISIISCDAKSPI